jgi:hypothetical protein
MRALSKSGAESMFYYRLASQQSLPNSALLRKEDALAKTCLSDITLYAFLIISLLIIFLAGIALLCKANGIAATDP